MSDPAALRVEGLSVALDAGAGPVPVVRDVSFRVAPGEGYGLVGESGAGKSTLALALLGLLPDRAVVRGSIEVAGEEVVGRSRAGLVALRGAGISLVLQDPGTALNPVHRIGAQVAEAVAAHGGIDRGEAERRAVELLDAVALPAAADRARAYPHELSGGMRQRVAIAIAMAADPAVIVADEPTTALDPSLRWQVLDALAAARERTGAALVLISHDLGVVEGVVDRVGVLYAGALVEEGPAVEVLARPRMPYARALVESRPRLQAGGPHPLAVLEGRAVSAAGRAAGCSFAPRCPHAEDRCRDAEPPLAPVGPGHLAACHLVEQVRDQAWPVRSAGAAPSAGAAGVTDSPVLEAVGLVRSFGHRAAVRAVDGVDLALAAGTTLGLVGESGCGKTTLARLLVGAVVPDDGTVRFEGVPVTALDRAGRRQYRQRVQLVYQDAATALDPRMTVGATLAEPLQLLRRARPERGRRVGELLEQVGLDPLGDRHRYPHELSSGQRQRVGIARALAMEPSVVLLDEPLSSVDPATQAGLLALLVDLQRRLGLAYLCISHDLAVVQHLADRIAVMQAGRIVEVLDRDDLLTGATHPHTRAMVAAATRSIPS